MVNLMTLKWLESVAEKEFESRADEWVKAIAKREGVGFDELRPYLVSLLHDKGYMTELVFAIPGHTPIELLSDFMHFAPDYINAKARVAHLADGELVGEYRWYAHRNHDDHTCFYTVRYDLGQALMLAQRAYDKEKDAG